MSPIAGALTPDDISDVAAYYANVQSAFQPLPRGNAALIEKDKALAESGNATKGVPGCNSCHGAGGTGEAPTIPYLGSMRSTRPSSCGCGNRGSAAIAQKPCGCSPENSMTRRSGRSLPVTNRPDPRQGSCRRHRRAPEAQWDGQGSIGCVTREKAPGGG